MLKIAEQLEKVRNELLHSTDYDSEIINYCLDWFDAAIDIAVKVRDEALEKLHAEVRKLEEYYEDRSAEAEEEDDMQAMMIHSAEANAFTKVRWMIEEMLDE